MVLVDGLLVHSAITGYLPDFVGLAPPCDVAEAQRIHDRNRPRAHGENVAQDAADAGRSALERLQERRMVVRFNLERARPSIANIDDAGVLARPLHDAWAV